MIRIAICDDDINFCMLLEEMILEVSTGMSMQIDIEIYNQGERLNKKLISGKKYDLIFLDIELGQVKGMDIGNTIRNKLKCESIYIIYVSGKSHYALELFNTRPIGFLIKPIEYPKLKEVMIIFSELYNNGKRFFSFKCNNKEYIKLQFDEILYFESSDKKIIIHLADNNCKKFSNKLSIVEKDLPYDFIRIHKSYLVNYNKIEMLTYEKIILINGDILPISQSKRQEVRRKFINLREKNKRG